MRRVEIPKFQLCSVPGCPSEIDYHATHGKCAGCAAGRTVHARIRAETPRAITVLRRTPPAPAPPRQQSSRRTLTALEVEVVQGVAAGLTDAEIAARTGRAKSSVASYLRRARLKLGAGDRRQLVLEARRRGLIA